MRFASLGSGSKGNATLVQAGGTTLLLDCGFSVSELEKRLVPLALGLGQVDAILVTHEHQDHIRGVGPLARRLNIPVWMSHGTAKYSQLGALPDLRLCNGHSDCFEVGGIWVRPFAVPHDAREPVQFSFSHAGLSLAVLTDLGTLTPKLNEVLANLDALLLEFNHDARMLWAGVYPQSLKARVAGDYGHLSNDQALELLARLDHTRLRHLVCGHLSEQNNRPELVEQALCARFPELSDRACVLRQDQCSRWFEL